MILLAIPNPFSALDSEGNPCGYCLTDPMRSRPFQIVGGTLIRNVIPHEDASDQPDPAEPRLPRVRVRAAVEMKAARVVDTEYHRSRIACGDLIAANVATYQRVFGTKKGFDAPAVVLAEFQRTRVAEWRATHGGEAPPAAEFAFAQSGEDEGLTVKMLTPDADGGIDAGKVGGEPVLLVAHLGENKTMTGAGTIALKPTTEPGTPAVADATDDAAPLPADGSTASATP